MAPAREYDEEVLVTSPEELYDMLADGDLDEDEVDLLVALLESPLDLNRADRKLLYDLPGVTYELADAIIAFRSAKGRFDKVEELLQVPGMEQAVFDQMLPFVTVTPVAKAAAGGGGPKVRGRAKLGSIWRSGLDKPPARLTEIQYGPQAYLLAKVSGYTYFTGGLLATYRKRTTALWDYSYGHLVSSGPENHFDLDTLYLQWGYGAWNVVAGSYDVGFGERLTFDSSTRRDPQGFYDATLIGEDNEKGRLRPREGLFGVAAQMLGADVPGGWVDTTLFASTQLRDSYQYRFENFIYGPDEYAGLTGSCLDTGCPDGFTCDERDLVCRSTRLYSSDDPTSTYRYITYKDSFRETLLGANSTFNFDDGTYVGVTGYRGYTDIVLAQPGNPVFSFSSRYPRRSQFGAIGLNGRAQLRRGLWTSGEYARTDSGGNGIYARVVWETPVAETTFSARYYDARYDNPKGRGAAARDEFGGLAARNEEGVRLETVVKPMRGLRLVTIIDSWRNTDEAVVSAGSLRFQRAESPQYDMILGQKVAWSFTRHEKVSLQLSYSNKDLALNGRDQTYNLGDFYGHGERRKAQLSVTTTRIPRVRLTGTVTTVWEDVARLSDRFGFGDRYKLQAAVRPMSSSKLTLSASYWARQVDFVASSLSDRDEPILDTYLDYEQKLPGGLIARLRYGFLHYNDRRSVLDRTAYTWYQLAKASLEARF